MDNSKFAEKKEADTLLVWGQTQNPGPWIDHSKTVARAAETIAEKCGMDKNAAYSLGLLHDIGRYGGVMGMRHIYTGYTVMFEKGFKYNAKICLTHSFPVKDFNAVFKNDCTPEEFEEIKIKINHYEYNDYDRLIQLCDSISIPKGVCLMEVRLIDIARRYNAASKEILKKWNTLFEIKTYFDDKCGINIYELFRDEIIKNTLP